MKKNILALFVFALISCCFVGCTSPNSDNENSYTKFEQILEKADSLINILPDSSLILCRQFLEGYPCTTDSLYARIHNIRGNAYFSIGDVDEAIKSMRKACKLAEECSDTYLLINAKTNLGVMMRVQKQIDSALILYNEVLSMIKEGEYKEEKAHLLTSIAVLYCNNGHIDEACEYADRAVIAANECGDIEMIMYANSQAGAIYGLSGDKEKGFNLVRQTVENAKKLNMPRYELKALSNLINVHLKEGNKDSVMFYLNRGEELITVFPENSVEGIGFLEEKYVVFAELGLHRESLKVQQKLLQMQNNAPTFFNYDHLWLHMARNYSALHIPDSVAFCYERAIEIVTKLRGEETDKNLSEFYTRFKTTEKELALTHLQIEKARSDVWLVVFMALAVIIVIIFILYVRNRKKNEYVRILQSRLDGIEQERSRLAQELHDGMCNDLYGIEMLMQSGTSTEDLIADVEKIRTDVRRISHELMPPSLKDIDLPQVFEEMVDKLRHTYPNKSFDLSVTPKGGWNNVPKNVTYGLYRICQELIGNMLRHANPKNISLNIFHDSNIVRVELSHDGTTNTNSSKGIGIGIESIKDRLTAINASADGLPDSSTLTITCKIV